MEPSLTEPERSRIELEERYRYLVRNEIENRDKANKSKSGRFWIFLNSSLGLWFLSTCVVGLLTFVYKNIQESKHREAEQQQSAVEDARRNASMITTLLPYLASDEDKKWRLAIEVTRYLKIRGELPGELESALAGIAGSAKANGGVVGEDQAKAAAAAQVLDIQTQKLNPEEQKLGALPPRVYIQIANESQRIQAKKVQSELANSGFLVPGIENIGSKAPRQLDVRYYKVEEQSEAAEIVNILQKSGLGLPIKSQPVKVNSRVARPRHYEIWFPTASQ